MDKYKGAMALLLAACLQLFDTYKKEMETGVQQRNQLLQDQLRAGGLQDEEKGREEQGNGQ